MSGPSVLSGGPFCWFFDRAAVSDVATHQDPLYLRTQSERCVAGSAERQDLTRLQQNGDISRGCRSVGFSTKHPKIVLSYSSAGDRLTTYVTILGPLKRTNWHIEVRIATDGQRDRPGVDQQEVGVADWQVEKGVRIVRAVHRSGSL
jgi:hypothetical protein